MTPTEPHVVVLTRPDDVTADLVVRQLQHHDVPTTRFDLAEFPHHLDFHVRAYGPGWTGTIRTTHHNLELEQVTAVWHRRPQEFQFDTHMSPEAAAWSRDEATMGLGGVINCIDAVWVNHPHALASASYKPTQLVRAHSCGLQAPNSIISNNPEAARDFVASCSQGAIYKPLSGPPRLGTPHSLFTCHVTADDIDSSITETAHLLQERIPVDFEVRATVVDDQVFAARIVDPSPHELDWRRRADNLEYTAIDVPDDVKEAMVMLTKDLGLLYAALDFIVDGDGNWIFLEANPSGQWAFIDATRHDITHALTDVLCRVPQ